MPSVERYHQLASEESLRRATHALLESGIGVFLVNTRKDAREKVTEFIPHQSEVMTTSSVTLAETGIDSLINESSLYRPVRSQLADAHIGKMEKRRIGSAPEWVIGSVHAVTEDGKILIASATGSQLPAYSYGASNVLWVVGIQKIVKNLDEAMDRIYNYTFPLENERAIQAYGTGSGVNKILIINKEISQRRIHIIFVKEVLGF